MLTAAIASVFVLAAPVTDSAVPQLTVDSPIELADGGSAQLSSAPFSLIAEQAGVGLIDVDGLRVELRPHSKEDRGVAIWHGYLGHNSFCGNDIEPAALNDPAAVRRFLATVKTRPLVLSPQLQALGEDLIAALRITADAGVAVVVSLPPPEALISEPAQQAIAAVFDSHAAELRDCFPFETHALVLFAINKRGWVEPRSLRIIEPVDPGGAAASCVQLHTKSWEFTPPTGGGVIVVKREARFDKKLRP